MVPPTIGFALTAHSYAPVRWNAPSVSEPESVTRPSGFTSSVGAVLHCIRFPEPQNNRGPFA